MTIAFDKKVGEYDLIDNNATHTITVASGGVASPNLVVVAVACPRSRPTNNIIDARGNGYGRQIAIQDATNDWQLELWHSFLTTSLVAGDLITTGNPTGGGSLEFIAMAGAWSFTGSDAGPVRDKVTGSLGLSTTPSSGTTQTRSVASELLVSGNTTWNGSPMSPGTNYTAVLHTTALLALEYQIVSSTGTDAGTWTLGGGNDFWECAIMTYGAPAAAPTIKSAWWKG